MHNDRMDQVGFICLLCAKALGGQRKPTRSLAFSVPVLISCAALGTIQVCPGLVHRVMSRYPTA
jgi:hypothetical protein